MIEAITETMTETKATLLVVDDAVTNIDILLEALGETTQCVSPPTAPMPWTA